MKLIKKSSPYHPFHIVRESYWPFLSSLTGFSLFTGLIIWFQASNPLYFIARLFILFFIRFIWWSDITTESAFLGLHTRIVQKGLRIGIILFIIRECFFFFSFFWTYFHGRISPANTTGFSWPPIGVVLPNPFKIPLLNTVILLSSGFTVTAAHYRLLLNKKKNFKNFIAFTLILAITFLAIQLYEYYTSRFSMSDGFFGSIFFLGTGFHGLHVLVGSVFLFIILIRSSQFSRKRHLGFEFSSWYWHFVDIVWLILYILFYWWSRK